VIQRNGDSSVALQLHSEYIGLCLASFCDK